MIRVSLLVEPRAGASWATLLSLIRSIAFGIGRSSLLDAPSTRTQHRATRMSSQTTGRFTRRGFLGAGGLAAVASQSVAPALLMSNAAFAEQSSADAAGQAAAHTADYLQAAEQTARWIRSAQVSKQTGIAW